MLRLRRGDEAEGDAALDFVRWRARRNQKHKCQPICADETDAIDDLAHALADYFRRKVVVVGTDDKK